MKAETQNHNGTNTQIIFLPSWNKRLLWTKKHRGEIRRIKKKNFILINNDEIPL